MYANGVIGIGRRISQTSEVDNAPQIGRWVNANGLDCDSAVPYASLQMPILADLAASVSIDTCPGHCIATARWRIDLLQ